MGLEWSHRISGVPTPAPRFRGDYQQLSKVATSFATQAGNCKRTLQQVKGRMATLQGGDWIGQGAQAFYREMEQELLPSLQRLAIAIEQAERVTMQISRIVKEAEEASSRLLRGEGVGAAVLGSLAHAVEATRATATPITTPTPTPSSPGPTATPMPPGWAPTPSGTPTFEEMQSTSAQQHQQWLDSLRTEVAACAESGDPDGCVASLGATIYPHYGWNLFELASSGADNPLPPDSEEVRFIMASQVSRNLTDPVVGAFIGELHLSLDRYSNFEPAFVEALKTVNWQTYSDTVVDHAWDMAVAQEYLKRWVGWPAGPLSGQFFVSSE
jgi:WXG100 family type VII secretion target